MCSTTAHNFNTKKVMMFLWINLYQMKLKKKYMKFVTIVKQQCFKWPENPLGGVFVSRDTVRDAIL